MTNFNHLLISGSLAIVSTTSGTAASNDKMPPPHLTIGLHNNAGVPEPELKSAVRKAERLLKNVAVSFTWVDCVSTPNSCSSQIDRPDYLILRIIQHALASASRDALGLTSISANGASATVFYERALALRTHRVSLTDILGVAMAHEIVHVLLPVEPHAQEGLMKASWSAQELQAGRLVWAGVSKRSAELIQSEAVRRNHGRDPAASHLFPRCNGETGTTY